MRRVKEKSPSSRQGVSLVWGVWYATNYRIYCIEQASFGSFALANDFLSRVCLCSLFHVYAPRSKRIRHHIIIDAPKAKVHLGTLEGSPNDEHATTPFPFRRPSVGLMSSLLQWMDCLFSSICIEAHHFGEKINFKDNCVEHSGCSSSHGRGISIHLSFANWEGCSESQGHERGWEVCFQHKIRCSQPIRYLLWTYVNHLGARLVCCSERLSDPLLLVQRTN